MTTWKASNSMRVAEKYEIGEDRNIGEQGKPEKSRFYDPWEFPELLSKFAEIQPGDDGKVLEFVHQWGLPGEELDRTTRSGGVDPVIMVEKHAAIVRFALKLILLIHRRDSNGVDKYLSSEWPEVQRHVGSALLSEQITELHMGLGKDGLLAGSVVLSALINARITTAVGPKFLPTEDGVPKRTAKANQLLQVIYCHLADAWDGKQGYHQCEYRNCPNWLPIDKETPGPKHKYCPPEDGKRESLCSRRERYHRSKESKPRIEGGTE